MATTPRYRLTVRDANLRAIQEIDQWDSLTLDLKFNQVGGWVLSLPSATDAADALQYGNGLIVRRNGQIVFSGVVSHREDQGDENGDATVVSGYDDNVVLADRLALPCAPPYTAQGDDTRTGACETVLRGYVHDNAVAGGAWLTVNRPAVPNLTLAADQARGTSVTGRARFVGLLDLLTDLAIAGGDLGFRVVQTATDPPMLEFQVYAPTDRTATAVFSRAMGNLRAYSYTTEAPTANAITVGGQGEGVARTFQEGVDQTSITTYGRRIEFFHDRRDASTTGELQQTISEDLSQRAERSVLKLEPLDTAGLSFLNGDATHTYQLGDKVTVIVRSSAVQEVVREVKITLTPTQGEVLEPVVGTPGAMLTHVNTYVLRHLHRRLSLVERR